MLQYLAAGRAVIVADEGGPTEWVVDGINGLRVAPRDVASLADALRRLGTDAEREDVSPREPPTPGLLSDSDVARAHAAFYAEVLQPAAMTSGLPRGGPPVASEDA